MDAVMENFVPELRRLAERMALYFDSTSTIDRGIWDVNSPAANVDGTHSDDLRAWRAATCPFTIISLLNECSRLRQRIAEIQQVASEESLKHQGLMLSIWDELSDSDNPRPLEPELGDKHVLNMLRIILKNKKALEAPRDAAAAKFAHELEKLLPPSFEEIGDMPPPRHGVQVLAIDVSNANAASVIATRLNLLSATCMIHHRSVSSPITLYRRVSVKQDGPVLSILAAVPL